MPSFYVAYQCDISEFQTSLIREDTEDPDEIEEALIETARACLAGWWATANLPAIKHEAEQKLIATPDAYVIRITQFRWCSFVVEFTSDDLLEAVVSPLETSGDMFSSPTGWPDFIFERKTR